MDALGGVGDAGRTCDLGRYRARDGSDGAPAPLDVDRAHAGVVVGKRGAGKSHTLGVLAEGVADAPGAVPVVVDPTGAFAGLREAPVGARVVEPRVGVDALAPSSWPALFGLDPTGAVGSLLWRAADRAGTLEGMCEAVRDADATAATARAALNHLALAEGWDVFDPSGLDAAALTAAPTVLDCAALSATPANVAVRAVAAALYDARVTDRVGALPWLLVDEAHAFFDGVAGPALETLFTRGRAPGVGVVAATQRPSALPPVAASQADLLVAHRLTAEADVEALRAARPTYLAGDVGERLPDGRGEALVVDDATESARTVRVRERRTPHRGDTATASGVGSERGGDGSETVV
jgi:hypothetical protein